jgi:ectoine hydroxylase-related dioxygenase (phytanoyl-CoA dioxygenase family)
MSGRWLHARDVDVRDLVEVVRQGAAAPAPPSAARVEQGVPVYDCAALPADRSALQAEWADVLQDGAGIVVLAGAFDDLAAVDRVTDSFFELIAEQRAAGISTGDHYAKPGANDRVWNAMEKLAVHDPEGFVRYYANEPLAMICSAWLGPAYQITSQVNVVNPGGEAQMPHCDYHLGFLTDDVTQQYPAHVHALSPALTLQGAVAHCDMPVETGPTLYLPHSHKYPLVYLAWRNQGVIDHFSRHRAQLPLRKGDAVFFNPSLLHAAGSNHTTDVRRVANLLQVSSAFGRAMEPGDRQRMCLALYPALRAITDPAARDRAVAACAEGYAFPTNLDHDPPIGGLAPPSQADVLRQALDEQWPEDRLAEELRTHAARRKSV